jgi:Flp pilus assembly pilin Flp
MIKVLFTRLLREDRGDDLIEYALLCSFVAILGILAFQAIGDSMNTSYTSWDGAVDSIWEPSAPVTPSP